MRILGAALGGGGNFARVWNLSLIFILWRSWKCDILHPLVHHMLPWNNFPFIITNLVINKLDNNISLLLFSCAFTLFSIDFQWFTHNLSRFPYTVHYSESRLGKISRAVVLYSSYERGKFPDAVLWMQP